MGSFEEWDFSAPVSIQWSICRPDKLGPVRLINPPKYSDSARLTRLQDYDVRRTPVLLVHGLDSTPATWALMYHHLMQFDNRPEIETAIFMATPHRGSELSTHFVGRLVSRLIRLPAFLTDTRNAIASILTADAASLQLDRAPNSIDTLSPRNRLVREVNNLPLAPEVTCHAIIGDRGKDDTPDSSDGVVAYWSPHLRGAASEKIVPSGHAPHRHPEGIEEVSRILKERLK